MKTVLITGGSSGIGFEISKYFARNGYRLLWVSKPPKELTAARKKMITEFREVELHTLTKDLSRDEAAGEVFEWTRQNSWPVDVLINNAGFGTYGYNWDIPLDREIDLIKLNALTVYRLSRLFLEEMRIRESGTIINISSNSSFQPVPRMNTYAATKAFVTHFSRGLQEELAISRSKVRVMTVCPAAIRDTPFRTSGQMEGVRTFEGMAYTTAAEVAGDVWKGFQSGKTFVVSGWKMRILYRFMHLVPFRLQQFLVRRETDRK